MSWKFYKKQFEVQGIDENKFILGVDLGTRTSAIAYFNTVTEEPELIDLSGGYGKPSMPSIIQYIHETREWVYGEYALLNKGLFDDCTIMDLVNKLGKNEYVEIGNKTVSVVWLLAKYIKELIEFCKNVNPLCEIAGIACVVPTYFTEDEKKELKAAFIGAGLEKQLIGFLTARECTLTYNSYRAGLDTKLVMSIDYGAHKLRASIDRLAEDEKGVYVVTESYYEDEEIGFDVVDREINELFTDIYCKEKRMERINLTEQELVQLNIFTHNNKAHIFKTNQNNRAAKLYYNFAYPPFVKELENEVKFAFIKRLESKIKAFITKVFEKSKTPLTEKDIDKVICLGGGFESPTVKTVIEKTFQGSSIYISKHGKAILAEGAAIYAAKMLGIYKGPDIYIKDSSLLKSDIGLMVKSGDCDRFYPLIEKNTFWWKKREGVVFTLNKSTEKDVLLSIYQRSKTGDETNILDIELSGIEKRPKCATRLKVTLNFSAFLKLHVIVEDFGFGEMFPKTDYKRELLLDLS